MTLEVFVRELGALLERAEDELSAANYDALCDMLRLKLAVQPRNVRV